MNEVQTSGPVYTHDSKIFELYAGAQAELRDIRKDSFRGTYEGSSLLAPLDEKIIPEGISGVDKKLYSQGIGALLLNYWMTERDAIVLVFKPKGRVPIEEETRLLQTLIEYYGQPTSIDDTERLIYNINLGEQVSNLTYFNGETYQTSEPIIRTVILAIPKMTFKEKTGLESFRDMFYDCFPRLKKITPTHV